jgi:enamine deaminase RidA (YjgF/YER057c/UK114 family)
MKEALAKAGSSMENVLKVQVALVDPEKNWEPMNEAYNTFLPQGPSRPLLLWIYGFPEARAVAPNRLHRLRGLIG